MGVWSHTECKDQKKRKKKKKKKRGNPLQNPADEGARARVRERERERERERDRSTEVLWRRARALRRRKIRLNSVALLAQRERMGSKSICVLFVITITTLCLLALAQELFHSVHEKDRRAGTSSRKLLSSQGQQSGLPLSGKDALKTGLEIISAEMLGLMSAEIIDITVESSL